MQLTRKHHRIWSKYQHLSFIVAIMMTFVALSFPFHSTTAHASVAQLDKIRVALFIQARGSVPAVTLSATQPFILGERTSSGHVQWLTVTGPIRSAVDGYSVQAVETSNYSAALAMKAEIRKIADEAYIFTSSKQGKTMYKVVAGQYSSLSQAQQIRDMLVGQAGVNRDHSRIIGPHYVSAGTFATEAEATQLLNNIRQAGIDAHLVYQHSGEATTYSVWIGEEAEASGLQSLQAELAKLMPHLVVQQAATHSSYLLRREEMNDSQALIPFYTFSAADQKVAVTSDAETIQVAERSQRSYRGTMELSQYEGKLALINEVPFEQYLYAVVSSEMGGNFPLEALKAQAVAARTFALSLGMPYQIAHISDTTYDQAYLGFKAEHPGAVEAVQATTGEVLVDQSGKLIHPYYSSNAGGFTADPSEVWTGPVPYAKVGPSPDEVAEDGRLIWNRVILPDGTFGYIRSDYTRDSGEKNAAGLSILIATESGVNVRPAPKVDNVRSAPIGQVQSGERLILFEQTMESNPYRWVEGPYTGEELLKIINNRSQSSISAPLQRLEVTSRGHSGRVLTMTANGEEIEVSYPDQFRTAMGSVPSTRFDVEQTANYEVLGAKGQTRKFPEDTGQLHILTGASPNNSLVNMEESAKYFLLNDKGQVRLVTKQPQFRLFGFGYGHGIGMSQWGAMQLANFVGYDYKEILLYYYKEVTLTKG